MYVVLMGLNLKSSKDWIVKGVILIICLLFVAISIQPAWAQEDKVPQCPKTALVKLGDHVFKVPRTQAHIGYKGKISAVPCKGSPVEAIHVSFFEHGVPLPGLGKTASFLITLSLTSKAGEEHYVEKSLREEHKTLKDLPREGSFYRDDSFHKYMKAAIFISANNNLTDVDGKPLVFGCGYPGALGCETSLKWRDGIWVSIWPVRAGADPNVPMEEWNQLFPDIMKRLAAREITTTDGKKMGGVK